jgi:exopolysaccharide biosynthesis polyprenyl glycosylphosphotransferase
MQPLVVKIKKIILLLGDLGILYLSLYLTLLIREGGQISTQAWQAHLAPFTIIYLAWIAVFFINDLYNLNIAQDTQRFTRKFVQALAINVLIAVGFFYIVPFFGIAPKTNLAIDIVIFVILAYGWRMIFNAVISRSIFANRTLFLGPQEKILELLSDLQRGRYHGWRVVAIWDPNETKEYKRDGIKYFKNTTPLSEAIKQEKISTIVIGTSTHENKQLTRELYNSIFNNATTINLTTFYEMVTQRVPAELLSETWFLENIKESDKQFHDWAKLSYDFFLAILMAVGFLAILPFISITILADDGWPIFYSQKRVGKKGKKFKIHKFRTMHRDAERQGALWAKKNDNRVTRIGRFLRRTRIDEMPQIINVLKGEMSFIGPRPERPNFVDDLTEMMPYYPIRHLTKPGLTGWAQINYEYAASFEENLKKLQYDLYYIKNRSLILDLKILLKTLGIIISRKGQ